MSQPEEVIIIDGRTRSNIRPGLTVDIVLKQDQRTGKRTRGIVKDLLTSSPTHPHGIKVRLADGQVGRVQEIITGTTTN
ncbi:putative repeat protein (TIGR03833 family) [Tumebacillus permanentifrigoris]|uniref:Putative repeat protein (TIGR03833 family) n=1 Tax=Tumebacillus permanentifrigoris TaxID=378543 RepID=A0A316DDW2_9BACL|nr:putative repeat protein (TIGR03833 family) [Tumebacillus permanentifrigoris]